MNRTLTVIATGAVMVAAGVAQADITYHNGTTYSGVFDDSMSTLLLGGSGDVNVDLYAFESSQLNGMMKSFNSIEQHALSYLCDPGELPLPVLETVYNWSGVDWFSFRIILEYADFYSTQGEGGGGEPRPISTDAGTVTIGIQHVGLPEDSGITAMLTRAGTTSTLDLFWPEPFFPDSGEWFDLSFYIGTLDFGGGSVTNPANEYLFSMYEQPNVAIIPAPGAAVLAAVGFGCIGWVRRRIG